MAARRGSIIPLVIAGLLGVVLVLVVRQWVGGGGSDEAQAGGEPAESSTQAAEAPAGCTTVSIVASSEKAALLGTLAERYNASSPQVDGACVWMTVSTKASGAAATALARGWDEKVDGPRPDVWSPASSSWAVLVDQGSTDLDRPSPMPKERPSLVQTPLVIAMPLPMAEALGWPDAQIGWKDLAAVAKSPKGWASKDHPEWGRFKLGKTNPYFSTSGLNATIASYFAATGVSSDLTSEQVADPDTRAFVKQLESSVVHYGDTTLTFLQNMSREAAAGPGPDLRLGGHGRGEVRPGLQPRQPHREPRDPGPAATTERPPGCGLPLRWDPALGQPLDRTGRRLGRRHEAPGGR